MKSIRQSKEYKNNLNMMLRTSMQISESVAKDDLRKVQLFTILLKHQIGETLELLGEKNNIE